MKYLNLIKLTIAVVLILFGLTFGVLILKETTRSGVLLGISIAFISNANMLAPYTPLYAGICIFSGVFLLGKLESNKV